nr:hypothetical protein BaRGS_013397 [Batillaria attramentaria]
MGFGNVAKVFLIWDQEESTGLQSVLPCMDDVMAEWQRQVLGSDTGRQWFEDVSLWELPSSLDTCISAWIGGEAATVMEAVPESEVKDVLYEMLVLFLNKPSIPPPTRVIRSTWHSNPYTRGAYSFLATGAPLELHDALSQPLPAKEDPVLQLAGEACSKHYYSTAHGALDSGSLAARAVLRHYGKPAHE